MKDFPKEFVEIVTQDFFLGSDLLEALNTVSPISVRKNAQKCVFNFPNEKEIAWCENAYFLPERPKFTLNPLFHAGVFYPQEAGSMILDWVLRKINLPKNSIVLDLCAAPGGKSTLIASYLDGDGVLVANEVINQRAKIAKENLSKWGYANVIVTNNDPSDFEGITSFFDAIVVDAPCSGEGMFRKDTNAREEWSIENVNLCSARQKRILADVWASLKEGGYLIYSTCTFNPFENEENVRWIEQNLDAEYIHLDAPFDFVQGRNGVGIYGIPGKSQTEGFYVAVLRKKSNSGKMAKLGKQKKSNLTPFKSSANLEEYVKVDFAKFYTWNNQILAIPTLYEQAFLLLQNKLHIVKFGVMVGEESRKGLIPNHDLLMCHSLRKKGKNLELDEKQALKFLHGDTFSLSTSYQGFVQICFENEPLGWIKNLGNRFNNLYPKEYRIKMNV